MNLFLCFAILLWYSSLLGILVSCTCPPPSVYKLSSKTGIPSEEEVAEAGHFGGTRPLAYDLKMTIVDKNNYEATVNIELEAVQETSIILLNMEIKYLRVDSYDGTVLQLKTTNESICIAKVEIINGETIKIIPENPLKASNVYILQFPIFSGGPVPNEEEQGHGIHLGEDGDEYWIWTTLLQLRYARRVLPCYGHPSLKASFKLCIKHKPSVKAFSNMPSESVENDGEEFLVTKFPPTPPMSIYLISICAGENLTSEKTTLSKTKNKVEFEVICFPGEESCLSEMESLELFVESYIGEMEEMTGFAYPLPRIGFALTPTFPVFAMENFGLIPLVNNKKYDWVVAHEIIHQWIGNIVTTKEWNDVCLQEGLTFYLQFLLIDMEYIDDTIETMLDSMQDETLYRPLVGNLTSTKDIIDLCYHKPTVIFSMLEKSFGTPLKPFVGTVLKDMFSKYAYKSASLGDWIQEMNNVNKNAGRVLESFYKNAGYPIILASVAKNKLNVLQLTENGTKTSSGFIVPFQYADSLGRTFSGILEKPEQSFSIDQNGDATKNPEWIIFNRNFLFWGVQLYPLDNYIHLVECLRNPEMCPKIDYDQIILILMNFFYVPEQIHSYPAPGDRDVGKWKKFRKDLDEEISQYPAIFFGIDRIIDIISQTSD